MLRDPWACNLDALRISDLIPPLPLTNGETKGIWRLRGFDSIATDLALAIWVSSLVLCYTK